MSREVRAQALVLESLLNNRPLPGLDRSVGLVGGASREGDVGMVLVDDRDLSDLDFPAQIRVVTRDEFETIRHEERMEFLEFLQPEHFPGKISVRVQRSIALPNGDRVPVEGIVATFDDRDPLTAVEPTHVLAF